MGGGGRGRLLEIRDTTQPLEKTSLEQLLHTQDASINHSRVWSTIPRWNAQDLPSWPGGGGGNCPPSMSPEEDDNNNMLFSPGPRSKRAHPSDRPRSKATLGFHPF